MKVLRHARILRRGPRGRKAALALLLTGCFAGRGGSASGNVTELDVAAIEPTGLACEPAPESTCEDVDPQAPCEPGRAWRLTLRVEESCRVPGVEPVALGLPAPNAPEPFQPLLTLRDGDEGTVDPASLDPMAGPPDPSLVLRTSVGPFDAATCEWPFTLGWFRDRPTGVRQVFHLQGRLRPDGSATGEGLRKDDSVQFTCVASLRITGVAAEPVEPESQP